MDHARLRAEAIDCLRRLDLPSSWDLEALRLAISRKRGRPLHVREVESLNPGEHGIWVRDRDLDLVLTASSAPSAVVHDLAHVIWDHAPRRGGRLDAPYTEDQEREAEVLAELLLARS